MTTKIIGTSQWGFEGSMQVKIECVASANSNEYWPITPHHSPGHVYVWHRGVRVRGCLLADIKALRAEGICADRNHQRHTSTHGYEQWKLWLSWQNSMELYWWIWKSHQSAKFVITHPHFWWHEPPLRVCLLYSPDVYSTRSKPWWDTELAHLQPLSCSPSSVPGRCLSSSL